MEYNLFTVLRKGDIFYFPFPSVYIDTDDKKMT